MRWHPAGAQQGEGPLVGLLHLAPDDPTEHFRVAFRSWMKERGREEGRNLRLLVASAEGGGDRLPAAANELVARKVDLIIVLGDPSIRAAQQATTTIPIVGMTDDMLGSNLVSSLARPGGNTTGVSILATELDVKRLELLHEAAPQASPVGILADPTTVSTRPQLEAAARRLGLDLVILVAMNPADAARAADNMAGTGVKAVNVLASPILATARTAIIERLNRARLPAIYQWPDYAQDGGLIGYGPSLVGCYDQVSALAEKILKGAKPADLPVEQPTKFELAVNLKTAKAIGLTLPQAFLAHADQVIE
ncbi:MAG TPA: ABC transporter substrate-binding protein [Stellaceae bacterium]|nr:ABC transporter substrate-binding protein [Stellaceae bacterium]